MDYIFSSQSVLMGEKNIIGFGSDIFSVREINRSLANDIIIKNHYSHKFYNASYLHLGVFSCGEIVGVLQYGYAMNPASCASVVAMTEMDQYLELNRMWIDDKMPKNSESKAISYSIKYIKRKYRKIKWIQSFADERCGKNGIVYQACSFDYYGEHLAVFWELEGQIYHNSLMTRNPNLSKSAAYLQSNRELAIPNKLRQFRYIKFLDKKWSLRCLLKKQPYPKHYNEIKTTTK